MLHPRSTALVDPDRAACICPETGEMLSYGRLETLANQGAHLLRGLGLRRGDVIAVMFDNEFAAFTVGWAAERAGLYYTSVSTRLSVADALYVVGNCGAKVLVVSDRFAQLASEIAAALPGLRAFTASHPAAGLPAWPDCIADLPASPIADESAGADMLYSSGTTGRPKGVRPALPEGPLGADTALVSMGRALYGMGADMVYLSTSPLYHAAPLRWAMTVHRFGGTVILMRKFDAETALQLVDRYRVTHACWVPTHFVRLLRLPDTVRRAHDLSSMQAAIHAGAPCAVAVKQAMIEWWGPIIEEYYSGTEACGITALSSAEWLHRPGSVGKAVLGRIHIVGEDGAELDIGQTGQVYFSGGPAFEYHNDPAKTASAHNDRGWATLGDIGRLDEDGYLYLSDRKDFMIISGGVNIYPQEIESFFSMHPDVADIAAVGLPDDEMGEICVAVVQLRDGLVGDERIAEDLRLQARTGLGSVKAPKAFLFRTILPREPTGKRLKRRIIDELLAGGGA